MKQKLKIPDYEPNEAKLRYYLKEYGLELFIWNDLDIEAFVYTGDKYQVLYKNCFQSFPIDIGRYLFKYKAVLLKENPDNES